MSDHILPVLCQCFLCKRWQSVPISECTQWRVDHTAASGRLWWKDGGCGACGGDIHEVNMTAHIATLPQGKE